MVFRPSRAGVLPLAAIALVGHTGAGKSTSASLLIEHFAEKGLRAGVIKLAEPLYRLQREFYSVARTPIGKRAQNQDLMEAIAEHLRRISPTSLIDDFKERFLRSKLDVVVNDDLRNLDVDYPEMCRLGFKFFRVDSADELRLSRLAVRGDASVRPYSSTTARIHEIRPDAVIDNNSTSIAVLRGRLVTEVARFA